MFYRTYKAVEQMFHVSRLGGFLLRGEVDEESREGAGCQAGEPPCFAKGLRPGTIKAFDDFI